jgi:hypothetical protein
MQVRYLFRVFSVLATHDTSNGDVKVDDFLSIVLRKLLSSPSSQYVRTGVIGYVEMLVHLGKASLGEFFSEARLLVCQETLLWLEKSVHDNYVAQSVMYDELDLAIRWVLLV